MPARSFSLTGLPATLTTAALGVLLAALPAPAQVVLPYTADFESAEPYNSGSLDGQHGWQVTQGSASVTTADAFSGTQSVALTGATPAAILSQSFTELTGQSIIFVDFFARPVANGPFDATSFIDAESSRAGFVKVGDAGTIYVFDGNGSGGGEWVATGHSIAIDGSNRASSWVRFTFRQDYTAKKWDLYLDGTMVKAGLGFRDNTKAFFSIFSLRGVTGATSYFDYFYAASTNPLFVDADKDGMEDAWEITHGLNPATDDRLGDLDDDGLKNIDEYVLGTDPENDDSDMDGMLDGWEVLHHLDPLADDAMGDADNDGDTNLEEYQNDTDPWPTPVVVDGLRAWYRANLGVTKDGDNKVSAWADLSGRGYNVEQTTTGHQPVWNETGLNGQATVQFGEVCEYLRTSGLTDLAAGSDDVTVIVVIKPDAEQNNGATLLDQGTSAQLEVGVKQMDTGGNRFGLMWATPSSPGAITAGAGATLTADAGQVLVGVKSGTTASEYLNGVLQDTATVGAGLPGTPAALTLGNRATPNAGFNGQIAEMMVYNRALTTEERESIEAALMTKYVNPDCDDNGLPDAWETQYFGGIGVDPDADPDGDGLTNAQEYGAGKSPVDFFNGRGFLLKNNGTSTYAYDDSGRLVTVSYGNGSFVQFTHDAASNLTAVTESGGIAAWRTTNGLPADGSGSGADAAIVSGDGLPNLVKYTFGLDPNTAAPGDYPSVQLTNISGSNYLTLTYLRPDPAPAGLAYTVEVSGDGGTTWTSGSGATVAVSTNVVGGVATVVVRDATAVGSPAFGRRIRLGIERRAF